MKEERYDTNKPPKGKQDIIEQLFCMYPLYLSKDISKEWQRHDIKTIEYLKEFVKVTKAKGLLFSLVIHPDGNAFRNFVSDFDEKLKEFAECKIVHYIEHSFQNEDDLTFKDCLIFIFSNYEDQEPLMVEKLKEFYNLRAFI